MSSTRLTTSEIIEYTKSLRPEKVYPDPAEPDRVEEARKGGLNVQDVSKEIEAGIACLQDLFKQDRLHIHSSCVHLIEELETYSYPDKKPEKNEAELPVKENDHAMDAIRYMLYMQEGKVGGTHAHVHYAQSSQPRSPQVMPSYQTQQGLPPELRDKPKFANTYVPRM